MSPSPTSPLKSGCRGTKPWCINFGDSLLIIKSACSGLSSFIGGNNLSEDVRIELGCRDEAWYTSQIATVKNSFRRYSSADYEVEFRAPAPKIMNSELFLINLMKWEENNAPSMSKYLDTEDMVVENNSDTEESMSKTFSITTSESKTFSWNISFGCSASFTVKGSPVGAGMDASVDLSVGLSFAGSHEWGSEKSEGFDMSLTVPPKKTYSVRFKQETKDVIIKWRGQYEARGDVILRVMKHGESVYSTRSHMDELLSIAQRSFVAYGTELSKTRDQYNYEIKIIDATKQNDTNPSLLSEEDSEYESWRSIQTETIHCATLESGNGVTSFVRRGESRNCASLSARMQRGTQTKQSVK